MYALMKMRGIEKSAYLVCRAWQHRRELVALRLIGIKGFLIELPNMFL